MDPLALVAVASKRYVECPDLTQHCHIHHLALNQIQILSPLPILKRVYENARKPFFCFSTVFLPSLKNFIKYSRYADLFLPDSFALERADLDNATVAWSGNCAPPVAQLRRTIKKAISPLPVAKLLISGFRKHSMGMPTQPSTIITNHNQPIWPTAWSNATAKPPSSQEGTTISQRALTLSGALSGENE